MGFKNISLQKNGHHTALQYIVTVPHSRLAMHLFTFQVVCASSLVTGQNFVDGKKQNAKSNHLVKSLVTSLISSCYLTWKFSSFQNETYKEVSILPY